MRHHLTAGLWGAGARTRILAAALNARAISRTIAIQNALGATTLIRIADVLRNAYASAGSVLFAAHGVRAARARRTGGQWFVVWSYLRWRRALREWITDIANRAHAHRCVRYDATLCIGTTHVVQTGIAAFALNACQLIGAFGIRGTFGSAAGWRANECRQTSA